MSRQPRNGQQLNDPAQRVYLPPNGHNDPTEAIHLPSNGHHDSKPAAQKRGYQNYTRISPSLPKQRRLLNDVQKKFLLVLGAATSISILLALLAYQLFPSSGTQGPTTDSPPAVARHVVPTPTLIATPTPAAPVDPSTVLGIDSGPPSSYPGIAWVRLGYNTCGARHMTGSRLKNAVQLSHSAGVRVLLLLCQHPGLHLLDMQQFNDVAQAGADAVACGNEQMKHNTYPTYVSPLDFARFFDLCERTVHDLSPGIPVLVGSLDPHVGGIDYQPLADQVSYLNAMQSAMNTVVHPGGHWSWRAQAVGLIDSWHNGYPSAKVNSLQALFAFWAQQFHVDLNSGGLGHHLWVVEGTGCVYGCGLNSKYDISVAHILTLITDVQTAMRYKIPFFYFSGKDFVQGGQFWPMGVLNARGHAKPLRQDLKSGARVLTLTCSNGQVQVIYQEQLLARLYSGCTPPSNYANILTG